MVHIVRLTHPDNTHGGLHCLRVPERVYKLAVHQWHGAAVVFHSSLRCDLKTTVTVLCLPSSGSTVCCLCTVGRRAFAVSGANTCHIGTVTGSFQTASCYCPAYTRTSSFDLYIFLHRLTDVFRQHYRLPVEVGIVRVCCIGIFDIFVLWKLNVLTASVTTGLIDYSS